MMKAFLKATTAGVAFALVGAISVPAFAADTPVQGGSIIVTYKDDMATLDPAIGYDWQNWSMINSMFSRLLDYKPGTSELIPSLADSYVVSPDGLTYTFTLNPNAKFTNGRKVVAADVKYSIERAVNPKTQGPGGGFFHSIVGADAMTGGTAQTISGIEAVNDTTVKFTLAQPDATFLNVLALNFASAVPKEVAEAEVLVHITKVKASSPSSPQWSRYWRSLHPAPLGPSSPQSKIVSFRSLCHAPASIR